MAENKEIKLAAFADDLTTSLQGIKPLNAKKLWNLLWFKAKCREN